MKIKAPKKKIVKVERVVVTKPAHYKDKETGQTKVEIFLQDGKEVQKEVKIYNRVFFDAEKKIVKEDKEIWEVVTGEGEKAEVHEFNSLEDANSYYRGLK